jgi:hypothetical protein
MSRRLGPKHCKSCGSVVFSSSDDKCLFCRIVQESGRAHFKKENGWWVCEYQGQRFFGQTFNSAWSRALMGTTLYNDYAHVTSLHLGAQQCQLPH